MSVVTAVFLASCRLGPSRIKTDRDAQGGDESVPSHCPLSGLDPSPATDGSPLAAHSSGDPLSTLVIQGLCPFYRQQTVAWEWVVPMKTGAVEGSGEGEMLEEWWSNPFLSHSTSCSPVISDNRRTRCSQGSGHCLSCCPLWSGQQKDSVGPTLPWGPMEPPGASVA